MNLHEGENAHSRLQFGYIWSSQGPLPDCCECAMEYYMTPQKNCHSRESGNLIDIKSQII